MRPTVYKVLNEYSPCNDQPQMEHPCRSTAPHQSAIVSKYPQISGRHTVSLPVCARLVRTRCPVLCPRCRRLRAVPGRSVGGAMYHLSPPGRRAPAAALFCPRDALKRRNAPITSRQIDERVRRFVIRQAGAQWHFCSVSALIERPKSPLALGASGVDSRWALTTAGRRARRAPFLRATMQN